MATAAVQRFRNPAAAGRSFRRGLTLVEMIVTITLVTILAIANLHALATARRVSKRDEVMTELAMAANAQLARVRDLPWGQIAEGTSSMGPEELGALGLPEPSQVRGEMTVRPVLGPDLLEITVRLERQTIMGPAVVTLATWREKTER
jgi:prepilin-type N-terminal cleavage/methylation domain-containing protein